MRKKIKNIALNPLISGSSIIFVGFLLANILNFVFNISMINLLSKSDYGILTTLTSLFVLFGVFQNSLQSSFAKFAATYSAKQSQHSLFELITHGFKIVSIFSICILIFFLIVTPVIMNYLHIENFYLLLLIYITISSTIIFSLPIGIIQGQLRFYLLSFASILPSLLKIIIGVTFVLIGWKLSGAVLAIMLATVLGTIFIFTYILKEYKNRPSNKALHIPSKFYKYSFSYFITSIGMTLLSSTDIILVRHFFDANTTGQYAVMSLAGKSIFYFTAPLNYVFFPLIAYKKERNENVMGTLLLAISIVVGMSLFISFVYFTFPGLVINIFTFGKVGYGGIAPYLGPFSVYILAFSAASILNSYFLSIGKTRMYIPTIIFGLLQIALIYMFHDTLYEVIWSLFAVSSLLCVFFIAYYVLNEKN